MACTAGTVSNPIPEKPSGFPNKLLHIWIFSVIGSMSVRIITCSHIWEKFYIPLSNQCFSVNFKKSDLTFCGFVWEKSFLRYVKNCPIDYNNC